MDGIENRVDIAEYHCEGVDLVAEKRLLTQAHREAFLDVETFSEIITKL